jgi:hypothetical protein
VLRRNLKLLRFAEIASLFDALDDNAATADAARKMKSVQ